MMRALVCTAFGEHGSGERGSYSPASLAVRDVETPVPRAGEVLVRVHAASANFPDLLMLDNLYQHRPALPFIPGYEFSGVVEKIGPGVTGIEPGDAGVAITRSGGFAESAVVAADRFWKIPAGMDMRHAAAFPLAYGTSYHALKDRAQLARGDILLVLGAAGGVGIAGVQLGKMSGATVIACASSDDKLKRCTECGADYTINYEKDDLRSAIKAIVGERGVDVVLDPVGGRYTEAAFRSLGWNGRHLVVGFTAGEIPRLPLNLPLLKGASVIGVSWDTYSRKFPEGGARNIRELAEAIAGGKLLPAIASEYPLEKAKEALEDVRERRVIGKALVLCRSDMKPLPQ